MTKFGNWISVNAELPKDGVEVIVVKQQKSGAMSIGIGRHFNAFPVFNPKTMKSEHAPMWSVQGTSNVIYWMPLPELPEVDKK